MSMTGTDPAAVAAAEAKAQADATAAKAKADADAVAAKAPKFSQEDLDGHIAAAKLKARESGVKELLESLGVTDLEAAKATITAAKAAEEAQKSDLQKAQELAASLAGEVTQAKARAERLFVASKLEGALRDAGLNPARIEAALKIVDRDGIKVDGEAVTGITEAVTALKAGVPELFGTPKPGGGAVDASSSPTPPSTDVLAGMTAAQRAEYVQKHYNVRL